MAASAQRRLRNFVNGAYADPCEGAYSDVIDPSTGAAYAQAPVSSAADVDEALTAAATAFESWRDATPRERGLAMYRFADAIERRAEDFIDAESRKPVVVFDDADVEAAAAGIAGAGYFNAGQDCTAATRVLAGPAVAADLTDALAARAGSTVTGGLDVADAYYGPLNNSSQLPGYRGS